MKKKAVFKLILTILIAFISFFSYQGYRIVSIQKSSNLKIKTLPPLRFTFLKKIAIDNNKPTIIIFFSPDCDHCHYMIQQILKHNEDFLNSQIIMITQANIFEVRKFKDEYKLDQFKHINLGMDSNNYFFNTFGSLMVPSFYVYNKNHVLIKKFTGETKVENIINQISQR